MKTALALFCLTSAIATAQSTISPTARYAYSANAGWLDLRPSSADGTRIADTSLSGYSYAANFGWIHLGDGSPSNGHTYSNTSATDYGVNLSQTGNLTGYAYAANIGWIHFEQTYGQPRIDLRTGKFTGHAYSANIGWIPLDTTLSDLATSTISRPDLDGDGIADAWENLFFGNLTAATATSDADGDGSSDLTEYQAGTLPENASSRFRIISHTYSAAFTEASLSFTSEATRNYRLEYDEDLVGTWTNSTLGTFAPSGSLTTGSLTGLTPTNRRFFRAVAVALPTAP